MTPRSLRLGAAAGLAAFVIGTVGGALERGWPNAGDVEAIQIFLAEHGAQMIVQSVLFAVSAVVYLGFLAALAGYLERSGADHATAPRVAWGAGVAWVALQLAAQAGQLGVAMSGDADPALQWSFTALFGLSNLLLASVVGAAAVASWRTHAFPGWLNALAVATAASELLLAAGTVIRSGPLAPSGWLTFALYPFFAVWLVPTAIVMIVRAGPSEAPMARREAVMQH